MSGIFSKAGWKVIRSSLLPLFILLAVSAVYFFFRLKAGVCQLDSAVAGYGKYIGSIFIVCFAFLIHRISSALLAWYRDNIAARTATSLDDEFIPLLSRLIKIAVWAIALLVILPLYGVNISALVATLGVSSLAVALAAQDTIANIISGFMIMVDRPFRVGDKIKIPSGETVEVLDIGVRRSRFLAEDKAIIIIPNLELSKSKIINYTYGQERQE